jgi:hypothetical protein
MPRGESGAAARRTILVTDASRGCAIAIIRSLGRAGYRVVAADSEPRSLGFYSRWAAAAHEYPPPERSAKRFCDTIESIVSAENVDLVMPVTDFTQLPLATERLRFVERTRLAIPSHESLAITSDKNRTLTLARQLGIAVPETRLVQDAAEAVAAAAISAGRWSSSRNSPSVSRVAPRNAIASCQLRGFGHRADAPHERVRGPLRRAAAALCPGQGCGVEALVSEGRTLRAFQHVRVREVPPTGGASSYRRSVRARSSSLRPSDTLARGGEVDRPGDGGIQAWRRRPRVDGNQRPGLGLVAVGARGRCRLPGRLARLLLDGENGGQHGVARRLSHRRARP